MLARPIFAIGALAGALSAATFTVSKDGRGSFSSIQAAVDKARANDEVVILDTASYNEQVTLRSPLRHFVLRSSHPSLPRKPVIRWSDEANIGPKTCQEALDTGKITFDRNGALRLIGVRDIRIEGIAIDGAGHFPYAYTNVWGNGKDCSGQLFPIFLGNSGLLVYQSSNVAMIGCEIRNAYFGAYLKDSDRHGAFASRNSPSIAATHPFGRMASGNHLFEGNSIHSNTWGVFMESAWGLGSTFRNNLVYENHHATPEAAAAVKAMPGGEGAHQTGGAFLFKDAQHSSMTLQNNTFWHNFLNMAGLYRPGAQHLIVNNVFAGPHIAWSKDPSFPNPFLALDPYFPKRMKCNAYAAHGEIPVLDSVYATADALDTATQQQVTAGKTVYFTNNVRIMNGFPAATRRTDSVAIDVPLSTGVKQVMVPLPPAYYPGALLQGGTAPYDFSPVDQNRWVETEFRSIQPGDADFLLPAPEFQEFLTPGWGPLRHPEASGIPSILGAVPPTARPQALLRIVPLAPVLVEAGQMVLRFSVQALKNGPAGGTASPVIAYLRLVRKLPENPNAFGGSPSLVLPEAEAIPIPAASIQSGYNEVKLPQSGLSEDSNAIGFVEMAVQGMGALSNVAQFPILPLDPVFTVEALDETQDIPATGFSAGKTFRLRIAYAKTPATVYPVRLTLASGAPLKFIDPVNADSTGFIASPLPFTAQVQLTEAPLDGVELIWAAAGNGFGQSKALVFEATPTHSARGKQRAALKPADMMKRRNVMGRKIGPR